MWKTRKLFKRYFYSIILLIIGGGLTLHLFLMEPNEYRDSKYKIGVIERSIRSTDNIISCKIPDLPINNPEILKFYANTPSLECGDPDNDWVICEQSICFVKEAILYQKGNVICTYTDLLRKTDYKVRYGKTTKTKDMYVLSESDFAKVSCKAHNSDRWNGYVIGIRENLDRQLSKIKDHYNILMFGFDSLSRNAFIRKLPKTYNYLTKHLKSNILKGYNIVGDGTPQALIPILTGYNELELPETRKRIRDSGYVNLYPMIWNDYAINGYVTSFNEDIPTYGTFTYRLNGFDEQPTDHYMRTFYLEIENYLSQYSKYCIGHQGGHQVMLDYTKNFMLKYSQYPRFVFSFHGELSHDSINSIGAADDSVLKWLEDLKEKKVLENTILIMMSDHGNRFADVRNTLQGKQEERLPFFSFAFPESFKKRFTNEYDTFVNNLERLTTPFDIHETLIDILRVQDLKTLPKPNYHNNIGVTKRAISLLQPIPKNRSCADAYIEPHWCSCLNWIQINDTSSSFAKRIAKSVVRAVNNYTNSYRNYCEILELIDIVWLTKLAPHEELLRFKQNKDLDGYLADLSSRMKVTHDVYQVKILVSPGSSLFEASVNYDLINDKFVVNMLQVSRVNRYGSQANCIYDKNPELRKFCFCKNQT